MFYSHRCRWWGWILRLWWFWGRQQYQRPIQIREQSAQGLGAGGNRRWLTPVIGDINHNDKNDNLNKNHLFYQICQLFFICTICTVFWMHEFHIWLLSLLTNIWGKKMGLDEICQMVLSQNWNVLGKLFCDRFFWQFYIVFFWFLKGGSENIWFVYPSLKWKMDDWPRKCEDRAKICKTEFIKKEKHLKRITLSSVDSLYLVMKKVMMMIILKPDHVDDLVDDLVDGHVDDLVDGHVDGHVDDRVDDLYHYTTYQWGSLIWPAINLNFPTLIKNRKWYDRIYCNIVHKILFSCYSKSIW